MIYDTASLHIQYMAFPNQRTTSPCGRQGENIIPYFNASKKACKLSEVRYTLLNSNSFL